MEKSIEIVDNKIVETITVTKEFNCDTICVEIDRLKNQKATYEALLEDINEKLSAYTEKYALLQEEA